MTFNCWYPIESKDKRLSIALLLTRILMGSAMALHGWPKFQYFTEWMPPEAGIHPIFQALAATAEFLGGIALILGALTPLAAFGVFCTMVVAALFHINKGDPFVSSGGAAWELAGIYLVLSLLFLLVGPGPYSLDAVLTKKWRK